MPPGPATAGIAPLWWHPGGDTFDSRQISRSGVAATGASSPVPPGIPHDPGPGQYYASPAVATLLRSTPADQLAGRYPGHLAGTIGDAALPSPDSLVIIIGHTPAQLAHTPGSVQVTSIATTEPGGFSDRVYPKGLDYIPPDPGGGNNAIDLILSVVALAILTPVLIFIATATRLSAARREQRFAAMRLVGATRRQVSATALLGVAAGFGIFFLLRIPVAASRSSASRSSPPSCRSARQTGRSWRTCPASCSSSSAWSSPARGSPWPPPGSWPGGPAAPAR